MDINYMIGRMKQYADEPCLPCLLKDRIEEILYVMSREVVNHPKRFLRCKQMWGRDLALTAWGYLPEEDGWIDAIDNDMDLLTEDARAAISGNGSSSLNNGAIRVGYES